MSINGYAKIEQGKTDIPSSRLEQIAQIFGVKLKDIFELDEKVILNLASWYCTNNFAADKNYEHELEKAKLLLEQKDKEITLLSDENKYLKNIIDLLKK
jgi:hypothetical protein